MRIVNFREALVVARTLDALEGHKLVHRDHLRELVDFLTEAVKQEEELRLCLAI